MTVSATVPPAAGLRPNVVRRPVAHAPAAPRSSNRVLFVLIGILIGLALMGVATAFLFGNTAMAGRAGLMPHAMAPNYAELPTMHFSFAEGQLMRRLEVKVLLELDPATKASVVDAHTPRIVSAVNTRMASVQASDLAGASGTRLVKDAVSAAANTELKPVHIRQVLVQEMLLH